MKLTIGRRTGAACPAVAAAILSLAATLLAVPASAEITQDCILEGTVDMRTAEKLGQPVYVKFRNARRGSEAGCDMNRRSNSRRVQFISAPDSESLQNVDANDGDTVMYRYIERDHQHGSWELIDVNS
jgi:hypothetical protein